MAWAWGSVQPVHLVYLSHGQASAKVERELQVLGQHGSVVGTASISHPLRSEPNLQVSQNHVRCRSTTEFECSKKLLALPSTVLQGGACLMCMQCEVRILCNHAAVLSSEIGP